jgi:hypothetical protein
MSAVTARAQETEPAPEEACPGSPRTDCDGICSFDWRPYYEQGVRLLEQKVSQDYQTVRLEDFKFQVESDPVYNTLRETWYVRKLSQPGQTGLIYRCKNSTIPDTRDSTSTTEGAPAYNCFSVGIPNILATPWLATAHAGRTPLGRTSSGLLPLRRYKRSGGTDYRTWIATSPVGYLLDLVLGGTGSGSRLGYQRFGKQLRKLHVLTPGPESGYGVNFLQNNNLRVEHNRTWGNAIGQIRQLGSGRQIVSEPIGDMVQSVLRFDRGDPDCRVPNPTQSGGAQCVSPDYSRTTRWAGSPVISETRTGTSVNAPQTFTTVVRPLDFCHNGRNRVTIRDENGVPRETTTPPWPGTTDTDPLLWNGFIERSDTLTCKLGKNMRHEILRTVSRYQLAGNHSGTVTAVAPLNTYWLKPKDLVVRATETQWDFMVYCKNLDTGVVRRILNVLQNGATIEGTVVNGADDGSCGLEPGTIEPEGVVLPRARHAVIATRADGSFAYAVARLDVPPGGYTNVKFRCAGGCDNSSHGTVIIQAQTASLQLSKTAWSAPQESFLLVGSKAILMDGPANRLGELQAEAVAGGVNCSN